jgi:hypothetical protein
MTIYRTYQDKNNTANMRRVWFAFGKIAWNSKRLLQAGIARGNTRIVGISHSKYTVMGGRHTRPEPIMVIEVV